MMLRPAIRNKKNTFNNKSENSLHMEVIKQHLQCLMSTKYQQTRNLPFRSGAGTTAASNLFKNPEPNTDRPANGKSDTPVKAFPLIVFNSSP